MKPHVVSYYTNVDIYKKCSERLQASLEKYGYDYNIVQINSKGSWVKNCGHKPQFILEQLEGLNKDIVWLDIDSELTGEPILFETLGGKPFYFHIHERNNGRVEYLSGTLYVSNLPRTKYLLEKWIDRQSRDPETWDQVTLQQILQPGDYATLPVEYCFIFDNKIMHRGIKNKQPIVTHYQASREVRKLCQSK